jgi:hypothetical protein
MLWRLKILNNLLARTADSQQYWLKKTSTTLIYVGQRLQFGRTPIHSGRTNNKPQFHLGRTECPVVSSLRRTIRRMGRTMSVTDRYFKACSKTKQIHFAIAGHHLIENSKMITDWRSENNCLLSGINPDAICIKPLYCTPRETWNGSDR